MAVDFVGVQTVEHLNRIFQLSNHEFTVTSNFKQAFSALKRTGHARFRRGPSASSSDPSTSSQSAPVALNKSVTETTTTTTSSQSTNSSLVFLFAGGGGGEEGSVSNGKQLSSLGIVAPTPAFSSRKPPLPSSHRKRCSADRPSTSLQGSGRENYSVSRSGCHCCKRRKVASKREIRKVPIIGSKVTSIPADDYSWRKYGEKKIDVSPYPRVYYKCNSGKGCPARKRVELALEDSKMLLVTYDGEHRHHDPPSPLPLPIRTSLTG